MQIDDIGYLCLRTGISFLYVYAAFLNSKNKESLLWTKDTTKVLFRGTNFENNTTIIDISAIAGLFMMYVGGISVLLGIEPRIGSILLILFTLGGTIIHSRLKADAFKVMITTSDNKSPLFLISGSAYSAHTANVLKNISFVLILIFILIHGVGKYIIIDNSLF